MTIWWLSNLSRAQYEREQLAQLSERSEWLKDLSVTLGDGNLAANFDIVHGANVYELVLTYPVVFPEAPPLVKPRDAKRLSGHQYGASGELCLEHRPDNWKPEITGAMMIESAYRLLAGENPREGDEAPEIIDGHAVTLGQDTRASFGRLVTTAPDRMAIRALAANTIYTGVLGEVMQDKKISGRLMHITGSESFIWKSSSRFINDSVESNVYIVRSPETPLSTSPTTEEIAACIRAADPGNLAQELLSDGSKFYFLACHEDTHSLYWVSLDGDDPCVFPYRTLKETDLGRRVPEELDRLSQRKVGIVGCGSVGSKVATQLVRSGIGSLVLVDDDVFFEGNLIRHELSVRDIGFHKARALRERLLSLNPDIAIDTRQIRLGGQESSEAIVSAMTQLAECDLIVDATADPSAFNIIAAVCKRERIPVVWGSVFAGGIGGVVGRARPDHDPEPLDARHQVRRWCDAQKAGAQGPSNDNVPYEARREDGQPEIATDADVSVIAAHVARFAIDALCRPEHSLFPYSAYAIGLSAVWEFSAPFDTRPIKYRNQKKWATDVERPSPEEFAEFLKGLVPEEANGDA